MNDTQAAAPATRFIKIWDAPVRLFHWLLVALIAFSWWSGEEHYMEWHRLSGYGILTLLLFRIYWGFAGSGTARFAQFVRGPRTVTDYAKSLGRRDSKAAAGHNPLGGWSVMLMLAVLGLMILAGLFAVDIDGFESGPFAGYVSFEQGRTAAEFHEFVFKLILTLIALHIAAILFYLIWKRQNLIGTMIHGRRRASAEGDAANDRVPGWKALPGVVIALLAAYTVSTGFRF